MSLGFVRNAWYCAAWSEEVGDALLARRILDDPIVLFRRRDGSVAALLDICPHKFAPLSMGQRVGDLVQCRYHGLEFDGQGRCVRNPQGDDRLPKNTDVATYPIVERHGVVWIWTGAPALADPTQIPDLGHLTDPARNTIRGANEVHTTYVLLIENLMYLGHGLFLHKDSLSLEG